MNFMKTVILMMALAFSLVAADSRAVSLSVTFGPEVLATVQGTDAVALRIRLSPAATAQLWIADICSIPVAGARTISQTGEYQITVSSLPGVGGRFCLASTMDGLYESVPLMAPVKAAVRCADGTCYAM